MSKELNPESNISNLLDYLLEKEVDIRISVPDYYNASLRIQVDRTDVYGRPIRWAKCIDMIKYKSAIPEVRNAVVTQTVHELIEELAKLY